MRKLTLLGAILLGLAAPAYATTGSAGQSRYLALHATATRSFSLRSARQAARWYEHRIGFPGTVGRCRWDKRFALCSVTWTGDVYIGETTPLTYAWTDRVRRLNYCDGATPCYKHALAVDAVAFRLN